MPLNYILPDALEEQGWNSPTAKVFMNVVLEEIDREWGVEGRPLPLPTAVRLYQVEYHYPASGDLHPQLIKRTLLLEAGNTKP